MLFQGVHGPSTVRSQEPSRKPAIPSRTLAHSPAHPLTGGGCGGLRRPASSPAHGKRHRGRYAVKASRRAI